MTDDRSMPMPTSYGATSMPALARAARAAAEEG